MKPIISVDYLIIHCAATPADMDIGIEEIRRWHMQRGFKDVGYHYVIRRDGTTETGRTETTPGAHTAGFNLYSLGICLVGGLKKGTTKGEDNFTEAQWKALAVLLKDLRARYPDAEVCGHRDMPKVYKACPSFDVKSKLPELEKLIEEPTVHPSNDDPPSVRGRRC